MHVYGHTGEFPFQCTQCEQRFLRNCELKKHVLVAHSEVKLPQTCPLCPKNCKHTKPIKDLKCPQCARGFTKGYELQIHLQIHSDKLPYKCPYCPNSFAHKPNFMAHICEHTGKFPHKCLQCLQGFMKRNDLMLHMKTHVENRSIKLHAVPLNRKEQANETYSVAVKAKKDSAKIKNPTVLVKDITKTTKIKIEPKLERTRTCTDKELVETLAKENPNNHDDSFKCRTCNRLFANINELKLHEK